MKTKVKLKDGISLIVLVITIIVMIVLAGAVILALSNSGIIEKATSSAFKTDVKTIKEEYEYKMAELKLNNETFDQTSLNASDTTLSYNTKTGEGGNLYSIVPTAEKYKDEFEVRDGVLRYKGENYKKLNWAEEVGITTNRYEIVDGVLLSSNANLLLVGTDGKIRIPSNVVKIGEGAFSNVDGLKEVTIPGNVKEIGQNAFSSNKTLEKVVMEDGVKTIGKSAFNHCASLISVTMTDSVTELGSLSFDFCFKLENIILSNNITKINTNFGCCYELKELKLPKNITEIKSSFKYANINKLTIPKNLSSIVDCFSEVNEITIESGNNYFEVDDGILYTKGKGELIYITKTKRDETSITIPEKVITLNANAFSNSKFEVINLPSTLTEITGYFSSKNLKEINISDSNTIYKSSNGSLYNKNMTETIAIISDEKLVNVPNGVRTIGANSMILCQNAEKIVFPESVTTILGNAVSASTTEIELGSKVSKISELPFGSNNIVEKVTINAGNQTYSADNNYIYKLNSSKQKEKIVYAITKEKELTVPDGIDEICDYAFHNKQITKVILPNTLKKIGDGSFSASYLENIEIPSSVDTIGIDAFATSRLKKIKINKKKGSISGAPWGSPIGERAVIWLEN